MKAIKTTVPKASKAAGYLPVDYSDVYVYNAGAGKAVAPDDVMVSFWTDMPGWVMALFKLRNLLVRFVGLKGGDVRTLNELEKCIRQGGEYGFTSIAYKDNRETIMLMQDKHLNAYISVFVEPAAGGKNVYAITLVRFHRRLGRIYFFLIRPFHGIIVRSLLKRSVASAAIICKELPEETDPAS